MIISVEIGSTVGRVGRVTALGRLGTGGTAAVREEGVSKLFGATVFCEMKEAGKDGGAASVLWAMALSLR